MRSSEPLACRGDRWVLRYNTCVQRVMRRFSVASHGASERFFVGRLPRPPLNCCGSCCLYRSRFCLLCCAVLCCRGPSPACCDCCVCQVLLERWLPAFLLMPMFMSTLFRVSTYSEPITQRYNTHTLALQGSGPSRPEAEGVAPEAPAAADAPPCAAGRCLVFPATGRLLQVAVGGDGGGGGGRGGVICCIVGVIGSLWVVL